jgi:hypothetical protein
MSHNRTSHAPSVHMQIVAMLVLSWGIAGWGIAGSASAHGAPGGYGPSGPGGAWGGAVSRMGPPPGGVHRILARKALEGPPSPAIMRDSINLSGNQLNQYTRRYADHMAATRATRDSLRASMAAVRASFQNDDRSAARGRRDAIERQTKDLTSRDKDFDKGLKAMLRKDQQKRYQQWKNDRENEERDRWRSRRERSGRDGWVNQMGAR